MIAICGKCQGEGNIWISDRYDSYNEQCDRCKGSGRVRVYNFTMTVPSDMNSSLISDSHCKILEEIRKIEKL